MLFSNSYKTILQPVEALFKDRGSKFYAYAFPVRNEHDFKNELKKIKSNTPDATHHCYALILHPDKSFQKSNDDGEPSNTAGKPILRAILAHDLTNIAIVVVRYFGGTMLGVPGLIQAYHQACNEALKLAQSIEILIEDNYQLRCEFSHESEAHRFVKKLGAKIITSSYDIDIKINFSIARSKKNTLKELQEEFYHLEIIDAV